MLRRVLTVLAVAVPVVVVAPGTPTASATFAGINGVIAFARIHGGCTDVFTVQAAGTNRTNLTRCPQFADDPTWSPNGKRIAFAYARSSFPTRLGVMSALGGTPTVIATTGATPVADPSFSKSGGVIAFGGGDAGDHSKNIYTVPVAGGTPTRLTNAGTNETNSDPDFSPASNTIAWVHYDGLGGNTDVFTVHVDSTGANPTGLVNLTGGVGNSSGPSWSPDGTHIAFANDRTGNYQIYVMTSSGTDLHRVTSGSSAHTQPAWSPDGHLIMFTQGCVHDDCTTASTQENGNLRVVNVTDVSNPSAPVTVVATSAPEYGAAWERACTTSGCPATVTDTRRASLHRIRRLVATGRVTVPDGYARCANQVRVILQLENSEFRGDQWTYQGHWVKEGATRTTTTGRYRFTLPRRLTGGYRVLVPEVRKGSHLCTQVATSTRVNNTVRDKKYDNQGPIDILWAWVSMRDGVISHTIVTRQSFRTYEKSTPCIILTSTYDRHEVGGGICIGGVVTVLGTTPKPVTIRRPNNHTIVFRFKARELGTDWTHYDWVVRSGVSDHDQYDALPNDWSRHSPQPWDIPIFYKSRPTYHH